MSAFEPGSRQEASDQIRDHALGEAARIGRLSRVEGKGVRGLGDKRDTRDVRGPGDKADAAAASHSVR